MLQPQQHNQPALFTPFRFTPAERRVFARKEPLTVSQWAARHRVVPMGAHKGPWRNDVSPHLVEVMDTLGLSYVREVVVCKSPQTGGSEAAFNFFGYVTERDPSNMMVIFPSEYDATKVATDRIIPMMEQTAALRELKSPNPDDTTKRRIKYNNGAINYMAWSNSTSALASFPIKYLHFSECDKYPATVGKETDPITLGEKRARTYRHTYKIIKESTPTREDGPIWKAYNRADVQMKFFAKCPDCGGHHVMELDGLKWPEKRTIDLDAPCKDPRVGDNFKKELLPVIQKIYSDGEDSIKGLHTMEVDITPENIKRDNLARYYCQCCGCEWDDTAKEKAVRSGEWRRVKGEHVHRPRVVAFHLPAWISPDVSLSEIAAACIVAKEDKAKLIDFYNDYLAEPFIESQQGDSLQEDDLYKRRYRFAPEGAAWQVPMGACVLSAFADVQANRLEVGVVAWGEGYQSWIIDKVQIPGDPAQPQVWADLDRYLMQEWTHESGVKLKIKTAGVDSGYLAREVYKFVRPRQTGRRIYATKGSSTVGKTLISVTDPKKKKGKDKGVVTLINIGTETAKDTIFARLQIEAPGPGYVHFSDALDYDFFKQLTSEHCITKYKNGRPYKVWEKKRSDARNEVLDIMAGNLAVIELLNPPFRVMAESIKAQAELLKKDPEAVIIKPAPRGRRVLSRGVE